MRADYNYGIDGDVIWIIDSNKGSVSVTNDMNNIVNDIIEEHGVETVMNKKIMYKDSEGTWDGVIPLFKDDGVLISCKFYSINEKTDRVAREKVLRKTSVKIKM